MEAIKVNKMTYEFRFAKDEPVRIFKCSDVHFDNPKCRRDLFFRHLEKARKLGAKVFVFGDLFCFMQGKYDPRRSKKDIRPEHNVNNYIDAVINDTVEQLSPYKDILAFVSDGNHETAILKSAETDVLLRFVERFNALNGTNLIKGGYRGWCLLRKEISPDKYMPFRIYYHHGGGGGGEMTKGVLQHSRMNMHIEGADAIVMGHVHEEYVLPTKVESFNNNARVYKPESRIVYSVRTGAYKEEFMECDGGFHIEKLRPPKPLGGVYLDIEVLRDTTGGGDTRSLLPYFTPWVE